MTGQPGTRSSTRGHLEDWVVGQRASRLRDQVGPDATCSRVGVCLCAGAEHSSDTPGTWVIRARAMYRRACASARCWQPACGHGSASATTVRWGRATRATLDEHRRKLPGDDLVVDPMWQLTRAISIDATPDEIWPWLVQMGHPARRAGWYAPYWFDRVLWGIRERSADNVMPELQALSASDRVPDSRDGSAYFTVDAINPGRDLVLFSTTHPLPVYTDVRFSWVFVLEDLGQRTRLVVRARIACRPVVPGVIARPVFGALLGIGDFIEGGAMLRGIKRRAEASSAPRR